VILSFLLTGLLPVHDRRVIAKDIELNVTSLNVKNAHPETVNGVAYIPVRSIFESLEWKVSWDSNLKTVYCTSKESKICFKNESREIYIDGKYSLMDYPLIIIKNKSYVPRKFIVQQFGLKVRWNGKDNIIIRSDDDTTSVTVNGGNNIVIVGDGIIVNIFEPCDKYTINDMLSFSDKLLAANNAEDVCKNTKKSWKTSRLMRCPMFMPM
jgi:hypothetical protein